jgi:FMN-dependent NADH-azoreductase
MSTLLHIDASIRQERSLSRKLSKAFVDTWRSQRPADTVLRRDLGIHPPPFMTENWIAAAFTPPAARTPEMNDDLAPSDLFIAELERADILVIGTPMYNYGMPAQLKAWIDQVLRIGRTFSFDLARGDSPLEPILSGKRLVLLTSCGEFGFGEGGARHNMNHLDTHLRTCSRYLGVEEMYHIAIEYQEFGDDRHKRSIADALLAATSLAEQLLMKLPATTAAKVR